MAGHLRHFRSGRYIRIDVPAVSAADLIRPMAAETSVDVARRVGRIHLAEAICYRIAGERLTAAAQEEGAPSGPISC
jgi:hypothetical protein